jgi:hypothetical protein
VGNSGHTSPSIWTAPGLPDRSPIGRCPCGFCIGSQVDEIAVAIDAESILRPIEAGIDPLKIFISEIQSLFVGDERQSAACVEKQIDIFHARWPGSIRTPEATSCRRWRLCRGCGCPTRRPNPSKARMTRAPYWNASETSARLTAACGHRIAHVSSILGGGASGLEIGLHLLGFG